MNNDERELINNFFDRVGGKVPAQPGSVPMTNQLPPLDQEADKLIQENFQKNPEAGYRVTQMAVVQEAALVEAQNRIRQLEWQLQQQAQQLQQIQQQNQQQSQAGGGGFLGGLFGGGNRQQNQTTQQNQALPPGWGGPNNQQQGRPNPGQQQAYGAPPQNYPPGYQQGMFNRGGSGFLGSALTTAAGVAGGMFAYNALSNLFSGGHTGGAASGAAADPSLGAGDPFAGADPFAGTGTGVDPNFGAGAGSDAGWGAGDNSTFQDNSSGWGDADTTTQDDSGWGDSGGDDGSWGDDSF